MQKFFTLIVVLFVFALLFGCSSKTTSGDFNKDALAERTSGINVDQAGNNFDINTDNLNTNVSGSKSCTDQGCFASAIKACTVDSTLSLSVNTKVLSGTYNATVNGEQARTGLCKVTTGFEGTIKGTNYTCNFSVYYDSTPALKMITPAQGNSSACASIQAIMGTLGIQAQ